MSNASGLDDRDIMLIMKQRNLYYFPVGRSRVDPL